MINKLKYLIFTLILLHMKFITLLFFFILTISTLAQVNELRVMSYNVLVSTSISDNVNVIQQSNADIIGLQEGYGKSESIANDLGFYHYSDPSWSEAILSRYPIVETKWWGVKIELSPIPSPSLSTCSTRLRGNVSLELL